MEMKLWTKNYSLLWTGQFISQIGNRIYLMALAWYFVAILHHDGGLLTLFIISSLPSLLFGVFIGPLVERWNKKTVIIISDIVSGLLTASLALMMWTEHVHEPTIYVICFLLNVSNLFFSPSVNSILPAILQRENYQKGTSMIKMIAFLGQILGAAVGGILVGIWGVLLTIVINSVSFFISALAEVFITYQPVIRRVKSTYIKDMKGGFSYLKQNVTIKRVLMLSIYTNLFLPVFVVFIPIIVNDMNLGASHYGLADSAIPVGAVIISLFLSRYKLKVGNPIRLLAQGVLLLIACYLSIALLHNYWLLLLCAVCYGISTNYININVISYMMKTVDTAYMGRVFSLLESLSYASISLSYVLATVMSSKTNVYMVLAINACFLMVVVALSVIWSRPVNRKTINT